MGSFNIRLNQEVDSTFFIFCFVFILFYCLNLEAWRRNTFLSLCVYRVNILTCFDVLFVSAEPHPSNVEWHSQKTVWILFHDRRHQQLGIAQQRYRLNTLAFTWDATWSLSNSYCCFLLISKSLPLQRNTTNQVDRFRKKFASDAWNTLKTHFDSQLSANTETTS